MKLLKINTESGIPKAIEGQDQRLECVIHVDPGDDHRVEEVADDPGLDDLLEAVNVGGLGRASGFWVK